MNDLLGYTQESGNFAFSFARKNHHQSLSLSLGETVTDMPKQFVAEFHVAGAFIGSSGSFVIGGHLLREAFKDVTINNDFGKNVFALCHAGYD